MHVILVLVDHLNCWLLFVRLLCQVFDHCNLGTLMTVNFVLYAEA